MSSARRVREPGLRIATWNIHAGIGADGEFRPDRILDVLEDIDADIVGLQEVENRRFAGHDVANYLARHLGMQALEGPTLERRQGAYGNLLLSRAPARAVRRHDLSRPGREPRGAIEATFDCKERSLRVINTHLGLSSRERSHQLAMLLDAIPDDGNGLVLLGDLNEWQPFGRINRTLRERFGRQPRVRSFPASRPTLALDRVVVSPPLICRNVRVACSALAAKASDHLPVCAELLLDASDRD